MPAWNATEVLADSESLTAGESVTALIDGYHTPAVCVSLEDLGGAADDTLTISIVGDAGTYAVDSRTLSETSSYVVDIPQCDSVELTSTNGTTISAEARNNPR